VPAPLLEVEGLTIEYRTGRGVLTAVDDVSYTLDEGETLGIVGESGSGKSTQVLALLRLIAMPPARIVRGRALFRGRDLLAMSDAEMRGIRGRAIGTVFQHPLSSLNPVLTIGHQIREPLTAHRGMDRDQGLRRARELLDLVGMRDPDLTLRQYPHQLSGGMRQRVMIAIALSCEPDLLIADEPTTALDVTVQAQILDLVRDLKARLGMAVIWITHDLAILARIADTVQVMYSGQIQEHGPARAIYKDPRSAYTLGLLQSLPDTKFHSKGRLKPIQGVPPVPFERPAGDPFAPRNPYATERCHAERPPLLQVADGAPGHRVAAWYDLRRAVRQEMGQ
jgi:peptide/nickel transport system ATP-binding protein/oligopeptide transport system ATP-binding protein